MLDVMLDTETMGLDPDSAVVAIGAVEFDLHKMTLGECFYCTIDLGDAVVNCGLKMDPSTVKWWLKQGDKARMEVARAQMSVRGGLLEFRDYLARCGSTNDIRVWGNDPAMDNAIVQHCYRAAGVEVPWKYWNNRCLRTYRAEWPSIVADPRDGTHHNALDDAIFQAEHMLKIRKVLHARRKEAAA